jgi:peptide/nickel transport system permease protein
MPNLNLPLYIKLAWAVLCLYMLIGITAPYIASPEKYLCLNQKTCLLPIIPYGAKTLNTDMKNTQPWSKTGHSLGTDILGRDTAAGLVHGTRKSLFIGFASTLFGGVLGSLLGMAAGYYRDDRIRYRWPSILIWIISMTIVLFYMSTEFLYTSAQPIVFMGLALVISGLLGWIFGKIPYGKMTIIPIDTIVSKMIEIRKSIPSLFLILALIPIFKFGSIWSVIFILSMLMWSDFARYARAEVMNLREENFIKRAQMNGLGDFTIFYRHIWPNIQATMVVVFCFAVASCVLAESAISFLGLGLDATEVTWGSMLAEGRKTLVWWLIVFPGLAIFGLVWSLTSLAEYYRK